MLGESRVRATRTKNIVISIGETDLYRGTPLFQMKRDFAYLYLLCVDNNLKPLVTTIMCTGPGLIAQKADIFNAFIMANFTNVIDLWDVAHRGLESAILNMYTG